ncbi:MULTISPECIES: MarR family winged helix-turn-helix transcriptional regulator [unclassified Nocardioides]|uniref:MarR family winged helix-turn-helix transcriptional regulator n=1 Tax=unclassified Nocardioides TaxID=2615069 RepID=UPI0009F04C39|nr:MULTISPECIES: MarR family transcriptional regulator [unclassified Nocardioides]GAW51679.1 MarR family transcriptional regulator [Nocardioides sp. PD653-B2]GAW55353.1 MarR family transcriptional regulator [Nocardioides sp. PD653]
MGSDLDHVGRIMAKWSEARPDLDVSPLGIIGRLHRLAARLTEELVAVYAEYGLGEGEFDVLATLRREGAPYELTPSDLAAYTMVSSGAVTKRVDRCVERGWVTRRVGDGDARGRVIALTDAGRDLIDRAFAAHIANEHRLVASLDEIERARLARLLETWGRAVDA